VAGKGTASPVELAAEMTEVLVRAFPGRVVHGTGDAAFHGEPLVIKGATWTTRLPASAVLYGPEPPRTGRRGQPAKKGARIGKCKDAAQAAEWQDVTVRIYGKERQVQAAARPALWYGSFKNAPGQLVLMRDKDSKNLYDLGLFSLDMSLSPAGVIERYSWRWPIEPSNAAGKQVTGAGDACNRTGTAVERTVPFAFLVQTLMIIWYAVSCDPAAGMAQRRKRSPWYLSKATPSAADMHAALRDALTSARINGISPGRGCRVTCDLGLSSLAGRRVERVIPHLRPQTGSKIASIAPLLAGNRWLCDSLGRRKSRETTGTTLTSDAKAA